MSLNAVAGARGRLGRRLLIAAASALLAPPAAAQAVRIDPNTMRVQGVTTNLHVATPTPRFSWTFPGPGTQTNWQIQVDSDPNFQGHGGQIWFWDSGTGSKGGREGDTNVPYAVVNAPSLPPRPLDSRASLIYWRLRVQVNNDPSWNTDPNRFSHGAFRLNQLPIPPEGLSAGSDPNSGSVPAMTFPPPAASPREFFISTSGNDANSGLSPSSAFASFPRALQALDAGDTLTVLAGTYNTNIKITPSAGVKSGTAGNPITLRARPGDTVILRGVTAGSAPFAPVAVRGSSSPIRHWIVEGLRLGGTSVTEGVNISNAEFITIRNISFEPTFNPAAEGVTLEGGGTGNRILNSRFDTRMSVGVDNSSSRLTEIRGNLFTGGGGISLVDFHGSGSQGGIIEGNVFRDDVNDRGGIIAYLSADGLVVRHNVFHDLAEKSGGYAAAVSVLRCGKVIIENNTIVRCTRGISFLEFSRFITARSNILVGNGVAFDFDLIESPGTTAFGTLLSHNIAFNNTITFDYQFPSDDALVTKVSNCPPDPNSSCASDPLFVNAGADDFRLQAGSPARDAGDPSSPVPAGGGTRIDIGALEFGTSGALPYTLFQPRAALTDPTPMFAWTMVDPDNLLPAPDGDPNAPDRQDAFQLQLDRSNTFDSVNGRPLLDTGTVASSRSSYTIPDLNALAGGEYYMRVRTKDQHPVALGAWSNNNFKVLVAAEPQAPILSGQSPAPGELGVDPNRVMRARVVDFGTGVNTSTIQVNVGYNDASAPTAVAHVVDPNSTPTDVGISFTLPPPIPSDALITVRVRAQDNFTVPGPPNAMDERYSFRVKDTVPPPAPANARVVP
jgi:hypothetical protein